MLPVTFNKEQETEKNKTIKVKFGQPTKTNGACALKKSLIKINSNNIIPKHADMKNTTPTANVSDTTVSFLQYFLINTILVAKKKASHDR
jgi:hypothetical protein